MRRRVAAGRFSGRGSVLARARHQPPRPPHSPRRTQEVLPVHPGAGHRAANPVDTYVIFGHAAK